MRDLLFKNLTSVDRKRKVIASSEIIDREGVRTIIRRHFICLLREIKGKDMTRQSPTVYIFKERNTKELREEFFCKLKGNVYAITHGKLFHITFMHSLKICISAIRSTI